MKTSRLAAAALAAVLLPALAQTQHGFSDGFAPSHWTLALDGGQILMDALQVTLEGADDGRGPAEQRLTLVLPADGRASFSWRYDTADSAPVWDMFGLSLNGSFMPLSDELGALSQQGSFAVDLRAGDVFGFVATSYDANGGAASARVFDFVFEPLAAIPEPAAGLLMGVGLLGVGAGVARRRAGAR